MSRICPSNSLGLASFRPPPPPLPPPSASISSRLVVVDLIFVGVGGDGPAPSTLSVMVRQRLPPFSPTFRANLPFLFSGSWPSWLLFCYDAFLFYIFSSLLSVLCCLLINVEQTRANLIFHGRQIESSIAVSFNNFSVASLASLTSLSFFIPPDPFLVAVYLYQKSILFFEKEKSPKCAEKIKLDPFFIFLFMN